MKLTTRTLAPYIGGQIEVQNRANRELYRGEIKTAKVKGNYLRITVNWLAYGEGFPIFLNWVLIEIKAYSINMTKYDARLMEPAPQGGGNCIFVYKIGMADDIFILHPADGCKLNPDLFEKPPVIKLLPASNGVVHDEILVA